MKHKFILLFVYTLLLTACGNKKIYEVVILESDHWGTFENGEYLSNKCNTTWIVNITTEEAYRCREEIYVRRIYYKEDVGLVVKSFHRGIILPMTIDFDNKGVGDYFIEYYDYTNYSEYYMYLKNAEILNCSKSEWSAIMKKYNLQKDKKR